VFNVFNVSSAGEAVDWNLTLRKVGSGDYEWVTL
jgi:hypothetical protein